MSKVLGVDEPTKFIEFEKPVLVEKNQKYIGGYIPSTKVLIPHLFAQITQPDDADYLIIPSVSSERRRYVQIGFVSSDTIASNAV